MESTETQAPEHVGAKAAERIERDAEAAGRKLIESTVRTFTDRGFERGRVEIAVRIGVRKAAL